MAWLKRIGIAAGLVLGLAGLTAPALKAAPPEDAASRRLYGEHCAVCHGPERQGHTGPALLPESLAALRKPAAVDTITHGRADTAMPAFAGVLSSDQTMRLTEYLYAPPVEAPAWPLEAIQASRILLAPPADLPTQPVFSADPQNLLAVVEAGGGAHVQVVDAATRQPVTRFAVRFGVQTAPLVSADGRFLWLLSRDGWVQRYDLWGLRMLAEVRAGLHSRLAALSADGTLLAVATAVPPAVVVLNAADLKPLKVLPLAAPADAVSHPGQRANRISGLRTAAGRNSFVFAVRDEAAVWEIGPPPALALRRIALDAPLDDLMISPDSRDLIGLKRESGRGVALALETGLPVATFDLPGMPSLESALPFAYQGRSQLLFALQRDARLLRLDCDSWETGFQADTLGFGSGLFSHPALTSVWVNASLSARRDSLLVLDRNTLARQAVLTPAAGKALSPVVFSRNGQLAIVAVTEPAPDGAVVFYDTRTLQEIGRLPANQPLALAPSAPPRPGSGG